ncbi:ABC-2 type transport system ATP-binding protein [Actinopolyspora biskrensis]|uniref:ABC-2 type transport system ATP-binding protein n=1 Tax=Actinopolyspora biskrensis TaxID=1470178 RepID=A0A852ZBE5_9ACTN|nr:ATP-binding cassette domain-containing protein [Actinopolyspora biskrensis]NYH79373.1 ABC-2 type transport system ATP-binding protein [Actinopolyspora biskrensis]
MNTVLRINGVRHDYRGRTALRDVDLALPVGVTALLGPNGAGKSTLLGLLSTVLSPQRGRVELNGLDPVRDRRRYRESIGFLPQRFTAPDQLTVAEFVTLSAWWRRVPRRERGPAVERALEATGLGERATSKVGELSGGMLRRLGIAQALVNEPPVLLLDEPTVGLDPRQRNALREVITELGAEHTVLLSTHLTEDVAAVAERVVVLDEGRVVADSTLAELTGEETSTASSLEAVYERLLGVGVPT